MQLLHIYTYITYAASLDVPRLSKGEPGYEAIMLHAGYNYGCIYLVLHMQSITIITL